MAWIGGGGCGDDAGDVGVRDLRLATAAHEVRTASADGLLEGETMAVVVAAAGSGFTIMAVVVVIVAVSLSATVEVWLWPPEMPGRRVRMGLIQVCLAPASRYHWRLWPPTAKS